MSKAGLVRLGPPSDLRADRGLAFACVRLSPLIDPRKVSERNPHTQLSRKGNAHCGARTEEVAQGAAH